MNLKNKIRLFSRKYNYIVIILTVLIFFEIILNYDSVNGKFNFNLSDEIHIFSLIILFSLVIFIIVKLNIKDKMIFEKDNLIIIRKYFCFQLKKRIYMYDNIYKFIFGSYYLYGIENGIEKYYTIYVDINDELIKLINIKTYKECLEIMNKVRNVAGKMVYNGTDEISYLEEDLFMNYYKEKELMREIKNGG